MKRIFVYIHNNLRFSPRFCLWAVERKLKETYEKPPPGSFAEFALNQLRQYIEGRSNIDDDYYKHLVINTQSRTFEDANYVNSIGSKVVIRPLAETFEFSAKKDFQLQRTVVWKDLPSSSQDAMDTGDLPPGEIPESNEEAEAVDLPSGEMTVEAEADVPEDLPSGKRSRTEAKEEDVEMDEVKEEEPPQDDPDAQLAPEEEAPDFGGDVEIDDDVSETTSQKMQRANRLLNSGILDRFANSSDEEDEDAPRLGPRPRKAAPAMANFISSMLSEDKDFIDQLIKADEERRHTLPLPIQSPVSRSLLALWALRLHPRHAHLLLQIVLVPLYASWPITDRAILFYRGSVLRSPPRTVYAGFEQGPVKSKPSPQSTMGTERSIQKL